MELRHIFLLIAMIAILMSAIPSIYSLFAGEHQFYDETSCLKCHADIREELDSSIRHSSLTCENCHIDSGIGSSGRSGDSTHGNVINPPCVKCHSNVITDFENSKESHNPLVIHAKSNVLMKDSNEACISCHTTKSLGITMTTYDTFKFDANRIGNNWQVVDYMKYTLFENPLLVEFTGEKGQHSFSSLDELECEKCHSNERDQLDNSIFHKNFLCKTCHQLNPEYHASNIPLCDNCHSNVLFGGNGGNGGSGAEAHNPLVSGAENSNLGKNAACLSCHSSFNKEITFTRPSSIEWDVNYNNPSSDEDIWTISNIAFGSIKEIEINITQDGRMHNISIDNCDYCHKDIKNAAISGGHSNEQWKRRHDYASYTDKNLYCKSCHKPIVNSNEYPFNLNIHGAMKISCIDCHSKSIKVDINGGMKTPPYDSKKMGEIEISIGKQPLFVQSYLCIACKNTDNPNPKDGQLHFKIYTEPEVAIYLNNTQRYP